MPRISPDSTCRSSPSSARVDPYAFSRPLASMAKDSVIWNSSGTAYELSLVRRTIQYDVRESIKLMTSQNGSRVPDRDVAPPGRDRNAAGQDAPGPEGQAPGPERRPRGREGQERDRQRQARDRQRQERGRRGGTPGADVPGFAGSPAGPPMESGSEDELWAPLLGPFDRQGPDRGSRAHQRLREHADREPRGRGRNRLAPTLSRGEIVDAAIAIADAEGPEAISMRRIAQVLKAGTMSLYWHVTNKEQLLDLMLDALLADIKVPGPSGDWRTDLQTLARNERTTLLRHNWIMGFLGGRPAMGPNTLL